MPWRRRLVPQTQIHCQLLRHFEIVLNKRGPVPHVVVLVLARALIEGLDIAEQEVGNRVAGSAAVESEVSRSPELVSNRHRVVLRFAADLDAVLPLHPGEPVVQLEAIPDERCLEVVADVEEPVGLDLRNRRLVGIDRQPHTQILHAGHVICRREASRMHAVESDAELVQRRVRHRPCPRPHDVLRSHA